MGGVTGVKLGCLKQVDRSNDSERLCGYIRRDEPPRMNRIVSAYLKEMKWFTVERALLYQ